MRIGIDARFYGPIGGGGLGRYTKELVDNLEKLDHENDYVIFLRRENWDDYAPRNPNFKKVLAPYKWYGWQEQIMMPFRIWKEKIGLMHFPHFNVPLMYSLFPLFSKGDEGGFKEYKADVKDLPPSSPLFKKGGIISGIFFRKHNFVLTVHDLILFKFPSKKATMLSPIYFKIKFLAYKAVISVALKKAKKVIAPSKFVKDDILRQFKIPESKIEVIYEGLTRINKENGFRGNRFLKEREDGEKGKDGKGGHVEISNFKFQISEKGEANNLEKVFVEKRQDKNFKIWYNKCEYILYVGNAYPHKNLERLIASFALLIKREGEKGKEGKENKNYKLKLILIGVRNYFYERLEKYAKENFSEAKDRIIFFGYATDKELAELYKNAALYVFPSLQEGFGLPPLEAMSYGVPVTASSESCLPEILGGAALYFNPLDESDMADKMTQGLENAEMRNDLIKKGYEIIKLYKWEEAARKTLETYKNFKF